MHTAVHKPLPHNLLSSSKVSPVLTSGYASEFNYSRSFGNFQLLPGKYHDLYIVKLYILSSSLSAPIPCSGLPHIYLNLIGLDFYFIVTIIIHQWPTLSLNCIINLSAISSVQIPIASILAFVKCLRS